MGAEYLLLIPVLMVIFILVAANDKNRRKEQEICEVHGHDVYVTEIDGFIIEECLRDCGWRKVRVK